MSWRGRHDHPFPHARAPPLVLAQGVGAAPSGRLNRPEGVLAEVRVPATTANLGPAFDCAALALDLGITVSALPAEAGKPPISYADSPAPAPPVRGNLLLRSLRQGAAGHSIPAVRLVVRGWIPSGVGLGSSAAAVVSGLLLGDALGGGCQDRERLLCQAAAIEGHPDNAAAALFGGLAVTAQLADGRILHRRTSIPDGLTFVAAIPDRGAPTSESRQRLPASYRRDDVVLNVQRTALLVAAAFSGDFDLRPEYFEDRLHQPQRAQHLPGLDACLQLRHPGLLGVFLSGAGSAVMAVCRHSQHEIGDLLMASLATGGAPVAILHLRGENRPAGLTVGGGR